MKRHTRPLAAMLLTVITAFVLAACGSSTSSSSSSKSASSSSSGGGAAKSSSAITYLFGTAPDSLDPQFGYTSQAAEPDWLAYTGLVTYAHTAGVGGTQLIPGLATALPVVSDGGKTYTVTLRKGLMFSDGKPVKASDFAYTVERAIKIPWGGSGQFLTAQIAGATAFAKGKAKTISGITANDATGKIAIHLMSPYGAFDNVLAFPAVGLVPTGSPFKNEPNSPPPGVGPYKITNIVPNASYSLVRNPQWAKMAIPGIPAGTVDVNVKISSNVDSNALQVLNNQADVFDSFDTVPGSLLPQVQSKAAGRYSKKVMNSTYYVFMNTQSKPFSSQLAREAVLTGLDQNQMSRLGSGTLIPGCFFLPPGMVGHPTGTCPYGNPASGGDLAKAKALVKQSGMAGQPVTVWSETRTPRQQWMTYYTSFLNSIGFKATQKVIADATYFSTIGNLKLNPQTGFADWNQDFPNPIDFYLLLQKSAILPTNNQNFGQVSDPKIDGPSTQLGAVPTSKLNSIAAKWQALDTYVAQKAYVGVFGYQTFPAFTSTRIDLGSAVYHPVYGWDWSSFKTK
ncbi:MAG: ABC transporter substrate-binding protein [Candidatus Dormibacteraeota bacterium]|nr:ABC transporter substrate-binding protein [Candidatus Dormibacteraeota bacterium]